MAANLYVEDGYVESGWIQEGVEVSWGTKTVFVPRSEMLLIQETPVEIRQLDLTDFRYALHDQQDNEAGVVHDKIHTHNFPVTVSGVTLAQVVEIINDYTITFEDGLYNVNIVGGNSNVADRVNKNQVGVNTSNSAGLQDSKSLQAASFSGVVAIDIINGVPGTTFPIGTKGHPSNNTIDAIKIANTQNIDTLFIIGDITLGAGDVVDGFTIKGSNPTKTLVTVEDAASTARSEFNYVTITGILDGGTVVRESVIHNLNYVNGFIVDCVLSAGVVTLGGNAQALFLRCVSGVPGLLTPCIDMGGSGQSLGMRDYNGGIEIINKSGDDPFSLDIASGQVILDSTVTNGLLVCRGVGKLKDFSTGTAVVINEMLNGAEVANIQRLVELQRPHHVATGRVWYWDPFSGDDTNEGDHISRAVKTFAKAHDLAEDNNHDVIIAVPANTTGPTITTENIVISKNYLFLRGPGRDFQIASADDNIDGVRITGEGVEVSGMQLSTSPISNEHCVLIEGSFALIKDVWLTNANKGIEILNGEYTSIENVKAHHNSGYGIGVGGTARHIDIIDCHIGGNGGDGILINTIGGHEVNIMGDTVIHKNGGYGINISSTSEGVIVDNTVSVFLNTAGDINNLGVDTFMRSGLAPEEYNLISRTAFIEARIYIDTEAASNGNGSQVSPFNNLNDAKDHAETVGIYVLQVHGEITIITNFRGFTVYGVGTPVVNTGGQDLRNSQFIQCELRGTYTEIIIARNCILTTGVYLNGFFDNCGLAGDLICAPVSTVLLNNCMSLIAGTGRPTISMNSGSSSKLSVRGNKGGMTIKDCDHIDDEVTAEVAQGSLTFSSTCTLGTMVARGVCKFVDETTGATVVDETLDPTTIETTVADEVELRTLDANIVEVTSTAVTSVDDFKAPPTDLTGLDTKLDTAISDIGLLDVEVKQAIKDVTLGDWSIVNNQMIMKNTSGVEIARFDLFDSNGNPTSSVVAERIRVV